MITRLRMLCLVPFLLSLGGCPVWNGDTRSGGPADCITDGDCALGETCSAGTCVTSSGCTLDSQCGGAGAHCDFRGTCVYDTPNGCRTNADCGGSKVCVEGSCRDTGLATCQFDLECSAGQVCVDSKCTNLCTGNSQCGSGETCTGGRCVVDPTECQGSSDCPGSQHCVEGRCLASCATSGCTDADDVCDVDGFCRPDWRPRPFCTSNTDCAAGSVCELAAGICRVPCDPSSSLVTNYVPSSCSLATADCACQTSDAQFVACGLPSAADDYCRTQGELVSDCLTKSDCGTGLDCVNGRCQ